MKIRPFSDDDTHTAFRNVIARTVTEIESLENEYVVKVSPEELEQFYLDKVRIEPLILHTNEICIENQFGTEVDVGHHFDRSIRPGKRASVRGTCLDISIPFEGDPQLWRLQPAPFALWSYPEIEIKDGLIVFRCIYPDDTASTDTIKAEIDKNVARLAEAVGYLHCNVDKHNDEAPATIRFALARKREKASTAIDVVKNLGIPIRRRGEPLAYIAPVQRRRSPVTRPAVSQEKYRQEPFLAEAEYGHILRVVRGMSLVIERNPESFASLDEADIRNHFLIQLNGHYEGAATGETFNAAGKTDILIRVEDRNIFIAECTFWRGQSKFNEAIDQLFGYLSWRDSKTALILFNKTRNSSSVREKMHDIIISRPEYRRIVTHDQQGDSRYVFIKQSDSGREITITTLIFDFPNYLVATLRPVP